MSRIYFSDFFEITPNIVEEYGAFDISLINDLPLFIDPFLLFNSNNPIYQELHHRFINYMCFLKDVSVSGDISTSLMKEWFTFHEVKQTWLDLSKEENKGRGLGLDFATALK